jgi:DNA-binding IclR family transcriptional regulator
VTAGEFDALQMLANVPRGLAHTLMLAHGLTRELIADLVEAGLVTVVPDMAQIGEQTIEVELVMITDVGRRVLR